MNHFSKLTLVTSLLALGACQDFNGTLSLDRGANIRDNKGKTQALNAGNYSASVGAKNKKTGRFTIKANKEISFDFGLPSELKDENYQGPIRLKANDIGQDFDIAGKIEILFDTSSPRSRVVSCVYDTYQERICHVVCENDGGYDGGHGGGEGPGHGGGGGPGHGGGGGPGHGGGGGPDHGGGGGPGRGGDGPGRGGDGPGRGGHFEIGSLAPLSMQSCHEVCQYVSRDIYGSREEEYTVSTRERVCQFQLVDKNSRATVGKFRGSQGRSSSENVISRSSCRR